MKEISEIIGKGFGIWRQNINLCIPFLFSIFVSMMAAIPILVAFSLAIMPIGNVNSTSIQNMQEAQNLLTQMEESLGSLEWQKIVLVAVLFFGLMVLLSLINAFFTAGAIGMARQALEKGKTDTGTMWSSGRKHFLNMFFSTLLIGLMTLFGLVLLLPGILVLPRPVQAEPVAMGLLVAGFLIFVLYALVLSLVLAAAPYALVVEGLGPVQAIHAGIGFFRYNKFDVLILWLVVAALSIALQMIGGSISTGSTVTYQPLSLITGLVNLLVYAPLSSLWWTMLYMDRKGMLKGDEVKNPW